MTSLGLCQCGCGQATEIALRTDPRYGTVAGRPRRFVLGHKKPVSERFAERFQVTSDGCWVWQGPLDRGGYGRIGVHGKHCKAYRVSYELHKGPIPEGAEIDHICRNRACVNPDHLEAVSHRENVLRGVSVVAKQARKTHCKNGHPLSGDNLLIEKRGRRQCRVCTRSRIARWKREARADGRRVA